MHSIQPPPHSGVRARRLVTIAPVLVGCAILAGAVVADLPKATTVDEWSPPGEVALVDGVIAAECTQDRVFDLRSTLTLPSVHSQPGCRSEVVIFSGAHATWVRRDVSTPLGPGDAGIWKLRPALRPKVKVWVPGPEAGSAGETNVAMAYAVASIKLANRRFADNRVGVLFTNDAFSEYTPSEGLTIGDGCSHLENLKAAGLPLYDASALNVYFVDKIDSGYDSGYNCFNTGGTNVIYVSLNQAFDTSLLHELGHALGLQSEVGHIDDIPGYHELFDSAEANFMFNTGLPRKEVLRNAFSLGQVYRMNVDERSWINQDIGSEEAVTRIRNGLTKECGLNPAQGRCPALWLGWP